MEVMEWVKSAERGPYGADYWAVTQDVEDGFGWVPTEGAGGIDEDLSLEKKSFCGEAIIAS